MKLNDYQAAALSTANYTSRHDQIICCSLGLAEEAGETLGKIKKMIRDKHWEETPEFLDSLKREMGDVLWKLAVLADAFNFSLDEIAKTNIMKLKDRAERGVISGEGDYR